MYTIPSIEDKISRTVLTVLEHYCYLPLLPGKCGTSVSSNTVTAAVYFNGPSSGILKIRAHGEIIEDIIENISSGRGSCNRSGKGYQFFKEYAEVLCDNILLEVSGVEDIFTIYNTKLNAGVSKDITEKGESYSAVSIEFENGVIDVILYFDFIGEDVVPV